MAKLGNSEMPPLTVAKHNEIERIENDFCKKLAYCEQYTGFDEPRANEYLRSYTIELFACYFDYYKQFPDLKRHAVRAAEHNAIVSALNAYSRVWVIRPTARPAHEKKLFRTIADHIQRFGIGAAVNTKMDTPKQLCDAYRAQFPGAKIIEICWAAKQTPREWKRWIKGDFVPGNTPDRSFRAVLTSSKAPSELRKERRPKGWK